MHIFNNNYIVSIILFLILFPFIINSKVTELFNNNILTEEIIVEENVENNSHLHLIPTVNYLNKYRDIITENTNTTTSLVTNLVNGRNDVYLQGKPMTSFDSLNYNRAFIDGLKYQNLEDRYIYKLNQKT